MFPHAHWQPITVPTSRDTGALNSLYLSNVHEYISAAVDSMQTGDYKSALAPPRQSHIDESKGRSNSRHNLHLSY